MTSKADLKALVNEIDAVLFDMDGTIVNTEPLHAKAASMVLNSIGIKIDLEASLDKFYGMTDTAVLKMMCPELSDEEVDINIAKKNIELIKIFASLKREEKTPFITPGLFDFLKYLKSKNKKIAVISASEDIIVEKTLECFEINPYIDLQMGRQQTKLTKPHPEPYLEGMRRLDVFSNKTLIFEDSPTGLQSAIKSNAIVYRMMGFAHNNERLHHNEISDFLF